MNLCFAKAEPSIQAIVRRRCEIEKELKDATEKYVVKFAVVETCSWVLR
jgi:hypothetical protein